MNIISSTWCSIILFPQTAENKNNVFFLEKISMSLSLVIIKSKKILQTSADLTSEKSLMYCLRFNSLSFHISQKYNIILIQVNYTSHKILFFYYIMFYSTRIYWKYFLFMHTFADWLKSFVKVIDFIMRGLM